MLRLELIPLLEVQRDLHALPLGPARFEAYLDVMKQDEKDDIVLPLSQMNPMGKQHVADLIDELLELNAESIVTDTFPDLETRLPNVDAALSVGLVLVDDAAGSWTNPYLSDATERFQNDYDLKRGWANVSVWTSQTWNAEKIRRSTLASVYRSLYKKRHGLPKTLLEMMQQEGLTAKFAGERVTLRDEALEQIRKTIAPHRESTHYPTAFACLYGDEGAEAAGYPAFGLETRAGFELALWEASSEPELYL